MALERGPHRRPLAHMEVEMKLGQMRHLFMKALSLGTALAAGSFILAAPASGHHLDEADKHRSHIEARAKTQLGARYAPGGSSPGGFDCSGLTRWTFLEHGADLPHSSMAQFNMARRPGHKRIWKRNNLNVGDLVFHKTTSARVGHVGIYIGGGRFISATSSEGVRVRSLYDPYYWGSRWVGATRLPATRNTREEYRREKRSEKG